MTADMKTLFDAHLAAMERAFDRYSARIMEINLAQAAANGATLATLELELDRLHAAQRQVRRN